MQLREKCPDTEFFPVRIFLYSVQIQENTDQKKLCSKCKYCYMSNVNRHALIEIIFVNKHGLLELN